MAAPGLRGFRPELFGALHFEEPDPERWPALELGWEAARRGGAAGAVLNAADEVAVEAFLDGRARFPDVARLCREALEAAPAELQLRSIADVERADRWARDFVRGRLDPVRSA